jgi:hypothetical protein
VTSQRKSCLTTHHLYNQAGNEASSFLKLKEEKLKEPSLSPEIVDRINMYSRDLTEFSNPVLIIGKVRKVIRLD